VAVPGLAADADRFVDQNGDLPALLLFASRATSM
jgi:hypothetical protein